MSQAENEIYRQEAKQYKKYSFKEKEVNNINMFKVLLGEKIYNSEIYISSELKDKIEGFNLVGFEFTEMWDSDVFKS